ncbi:MAG: LPS-assembly protein LptD [Saprospiraceae bacterium]|nr:LPS-assembly protein LptD [Saprospiraceae bacterium]
MGVKPIPVAADSVSVLDSVPRLRGVVAFSADTLEDLVDYSATDSIIFDNANHLIYLYGEASIKYQTYSITADFIRVNLDSSIALAEQLPDSLKKKDPLDELREEPAEAEPEEELPLTQEQLDSIYLDSLNGITPLDNKRLVNDVPKERNEDGRPFFDDGSTQFTAKRLRYNFKTRRGKVYDVLTEESNMFIHGSETKFVSAGQDTNAVDYVYSQDVILTTCNAEHPHYGIRSKKQKIIPNRQVIVGPSNLEIAGVPTPFIIPFGFFPIARGAKNGLIFPSDYEYSDQWGFGLRDIGYYFPLGEHFDLELLSDIYFNGSWGIKANSQYRKRYKYSGSINIGFSNRIGEVYNQELGALVKDPRKSFSINWSHTQDPRSRPNQTFSASVQMQTSGYDQLNYNDASRVLNNSYSSNIAFRKKFVGTPFAVSANVRHSQNTRTNEMQFTLPDINISMNRIFPFKSNKRRSPEPKWYEKISLQYTGKVLNRIKTQDTLLFSQPLFTNADFGVDHDLNSSASFNVLKYFNITPSVRYGESWYFKTVQRTFDPNIEIEYDTVYNADSSDFTEIPADTLSFGQVLRKTIHGFKPLRQYSASLSMSTTIFGSLGVGRKKGWFRGVRHVVKPTISFNFSPDYTVPSLGYVDYVQQDIRDPTEIAYSLFEGALFGSPSLSGRQMALSYAINNLFEAKVFSQKDTTEKKIKLFNSININGSHNFVSDSLKWSEINLSGSTQFFKGLSQLNFSMVYDPYDRDRTTMRRINKFYWDTEGKILRFDRAAVRISTGMTIDQIRKLFKGEEVGLQSRGGSRRGSSDQSQDNEEESLTDLFKDFRLSHDLVLMWTMQADGSKKLDIMTNSINTRGNIRLSPNWDISVGNIGYDLRSKRLTYPYLGFTRNLHCWEMGFNWAPQRGTYSFFIRVRQDPLSFIKIPYQRNNQDVRF